MAKKKTETAPVAAVKSATPKRETIAQRKVREFKENTDNVFAKKPR